MLPTLTNNRIIVAPLCWGLGHATRCVLIIRTLMAQGNHVAIASDGEALEILRAEFPKLDHFTLPSYNIHYKYSSMMVNMAMQSPHILLTIDEEQEAAERIVQEWSAHTIISDNRLGFRSAMTHNIYLTHQLHIPHSNMIIAGIATRLHRKYIHDFDECWVPDNEGADSVAGKMTAPSLKVPKKYIGVQSRFVRKDLPIMYDYAAVLSGPEPQRTKLEEKLIEIFNQRPDLKLCLVRGTNKTQGEDTEIGINIKCYDLLGSEKLNDIICGSRRIICRSGYTSMMDLIHLQKPAIIIPTPGQYEQEYLAKSLAKNELFESVNQDKLSTDMLQ